MKTTDKTLPVLRRDRTAGRIIRRGLTVPAAAAAIGPLEHGCELFGVFRGQFSLVDILQHVLECTGAADCVISTWTASNADLTFAFNLLRDGRIRTMRFLCDFSFQARQPSYLQAMREKFGDASIRITKNHCKFILVTNTEWAVVVRSSANLNENKRLEYFEISDDRQLADYLLGVVAALFEAQPEGAAFERRPIENIREFEGLTFGEDGAAAPVDALKSTDSAKFFSDDPFGCDLRRVGLSYEK
jgi:hypothetical protein